MGAVGRLIFRGAEADVNLDRWLGRVCVAKRRVPKRYRRPELDARIRRERLRSEAALLAAARRAGVSVPIVLDIDDGTCTLRMERLRGPTLRQVLSARPGIAAARLKAWGRMIGRLHRAGLVHGDLTTSNAIVEAGRVVLVDFGLASRSLDVEDWGVDLLLVERTLGSTHPARARGWLAHVLAGYRREQPKARAAIRRMGEIRARARYV